MYREQKTDYTCAVACMLMILDELDPNHTYTETEVAQMCDTTDNKGTLPKDIVSFFKERGYNAVYKENGTISDLQRFKDDGKHIIMIISVDVPHCIVYKGNNGNHFFFDDPYFGKNMSRYIRKFEKGNQNYPQMRWEVETKSLKKYYPDIDFSPIEDYVGKGQFIIVY